MSERTARPRSASPTRLAARLAASAGLAASLALTAVAPAAATAGPATGAVSAETARHTASGGRTVALTFDDGPGPATPLVLDLLARYGARATFCVVGDRVTADPAAVRRIVAEGHRLCDHSVDHPQPFAGLTPDEVYYQITAARDTIRQAAGPDAPISWFRAPGGQFNAVDRRMSADLGLRPLGWAVDPRDWSRPGTDKIVQSVQTRLQPGGVVLLHDGGGDRGQTVEALKVLLPWLLAEGYGFDFPEV
ncbi:polysaccharide deacetylase family protein [Kitasatospora sp. NPDC056327]|uniref:polysaccharide deacetylase family protein n=1 Tax=Kitasatospora sp. NPDC056327 TaxID=3345785 RepID=UPI0035E03117